MLTCYKCKSFVAISHSKDITYQNIWNYSSVHLINFSWHTNVLLLMLCAYEAYGDTQVCNVMQSAKV